MAIDIILSALDQIIYFKYQNLYCKCNFKDFIEILYKTYNPTKIKRIKEFRG